MVSLMSLPWTQEASNTVIVQLCDGCVEIIVLLFHAS